MADFEQAYVRTMKHEGGYSNDPTDFGQETYKGISRRFHPQWEGWALIDEAKHKANFPSNLELDHRLGALVREFYRKTFWNAIMGDNLPSDALARELFDTAVNMHPTRAVSFLQRALNVLNRDGKLYEDLLADGLLGTKTLMALNTYLRSDSEALLLKVMNVLQGMHYIQLMEKHTSQERFARGWFGRVAVEVD